MIDLRYAITAARNEYATKICRIMENPKAYVIQCAYDDGEIALGASLLRVDKQSGNVSAFTQENQEYFEPLKTIPFPDGYGDIFVKPKPHDN